MKRLPPAATALTLVMLAVLASLGLWQLERHDWKTALLAQLIANSAAPVRPLPSTLAGADEFAPVSLSCRWLGQAVRLPGSGPGGAAGERVYQRCQPGDGGAPVTVDLGFVRLGESAPARPHGALVGVLRAWPTLSAVERVSGARRIGPQTFAADRDFFVQLKAPTVAGAPNPAPLNPADLPNNHLSYAFQWFGFAGILLGVFVLFVARSKH